MSRTLELPEPIYEGLMEAARRSGVSPADWIAEKLPSHEPPAPAEAIAAARERLFRCVISSGDAGGADNDRIDADLAREYGDSHEPRGTGDPGS